jgi:hypothetical protein
MYTGTGLRVLAALQPSCTFALLHSLQSVGRDAQVSKQTQFAVVVRRPVCRQWGIRVRRRQRHCRQFFLLLLRGWAGEPGRADPAEEGVDGNVGYHSVNVVSQPSIEHRIQADAFGFAR